MNKAKRIRLETIGLVLFIFILFCSCKKKETKLVELKIPTTEILASYEIIPFDSTAVVSFFKKYPKLTPYRKQVIAVYSKQQFNYIWYDEKGKKETASVLNDKIDAIGDEGVHASVPYIEVFDALFQNGSDKPNIETELFLTSYFFFYTSKVVQGIDDSKTHQLGWYLPRKKMSYINYLDSLLVNPDKIDSNEYLLPQYYRLKEVLQKYRAIAVKGGWNSIETTTNFKSFKPGDTAVAIGQIRTRLFLTNDIDTDSRSTFYDASLQNAILKYKKRNGFALDATVLPKHLQDMNVSVDDRIKTIIVNMERCRWISADITKAKEFVVVNIPSYKLIYFKNNKVALTSNVVVGTVMHKTIVFSGMMSYIVFSPYWNVPKSILYKEIIPAIRKNKNYLAKHNMEWYKGDVRQKPGPKNSLGLVKFLFPNSNNIYLHDTPSKSLLTEEVRTFSHGCIRIAKPKELANLILENDSNWTPEKIDAAMNSGKETWYTLKNKIPVYIGYFTSWVDSEGTINFYKDVYNRDSRLEELLMNE
jgi:murein L,D-transpeptidase YcbB/YkuD